MEENHVKRKETRMEGLKRRVEEARKFNLLSDTFMSVALRDREAAQEVYTVNY